MVFALWQKEQMHSVISVDYIKYIPIYILYSFYHYVNRKSTIFLKKFKNNQLLEKDIRGMHKLFYIIVYERVGK